MAARTSVVSNNRKIYDVTDRLKSDKSKRLYKYLFKGFLEYIHVEDTDKESQMRLLQKDLPEIEDIIIDYVVNHLAAKRHLKHDSIHTAMAAIVHFFSVNRVRLDSGHISGFIPDSEDHIEDRPYTNEEIQKMLVAAADGTGRKELIVMLMVSTGMRIGAIPDLQYQDIKKMDVEGGATVYRINVYDRSHNHRYFTFLTPEASRVLDNYLDYRKRFKEVLKPQSPLIREEFNFDHGNPNAAPKPLKVKSLDKAIQRLIKKSGINTTGKVKRTNGFRKRVLTLMKKAGIDHTDRHYMIGHKGIRRKELDQPYDRPTEEDMLVEWSKAIDLLTINPTEPRLQKKIKELESERTEEIAALKADMNELKRLVHFVGTGDPDKLKEERQLRVMKHLQQEVSNELIDEYYEGEAEADAAAAAAVRDQKLK